MRYFFAFIVCSLLFSHQLFADGFLVAGPAKDYYWHPIDRVSTYTKVFPAKFNPMWVEMRSEKVNVVIQNNVAEVNIEQTFYNPSYDTLQAYWLFPVPKGMKIEGFKVAMNDGKNDFQSRAELVPADKAFYTYDDLVKRSNNPSFWRYAQMDMYKMPIYSTLPRNTYTIKVSYKQPLNPIANTYEFTHPLSTQSLNPSPLQSFEFNVSVKASGKKITNLVCVSHPIEAKQTSPEEATFSLGASKAKMDKDFTIFYTTSDQHIGYALYTYKRPGQDGYFFLSFDAAYVADQDLVNKEVLFVVDASDNLSAAQAPSVKKALSGWLDLLRKGDKFNVVTFSDALKPAFSEFKSVESGAIAEAKTFINGIAPSGKSNMEMALKHVFATNDKTSKVLPYFVVWVTAGGASAGNTDPDDLADMIQIANIKTLRLYPFGMGSADVPLLNRMASTTQAFSSYVLPNEDLEKKASEFFTTINYPVLNNLQLYFGDNFAVSDMFPRKPENFFKGKKMTLAGRYKKAGTVNVSLIGDVNDKMNRFNFQTPFPDDDTRYDFVPRLWALRAITAKAQKLMAEGEDEDLTDEIIELAQEHAISTPYTDFWVNQEAKLGGEMASTQYNALDKHAYLDKANGVEAMTASRDLRMLYTVDSPQQLALLDASPDQAPKADSYLVQGKIMYKSSNGAWVNDEALDKRASLQRIAFASKEYYDLIAANRTLTEFAWLGRNLLFEAIGKGYETYEDPEIYAKQKEQLDLIEKAKREAELEKLKNKTK